MNKYKHNIQVIRGDITTAKVDCIVNAANKWLIPGGGVDHAIHQAAGPELAKAVKKFHHCDLVTPSSHLDFNSKQHRSSMLWDPFGTNLRTKRNFNESFLRLINPFTN